MNYENRICCFIDILGFKQHLKQTINENGEDNIVKIRSINSILEFIKEWTSDFGLSESKTVTYFSDSIVISYKYNEQSQLFITLRDLMLLNMELANKGYLTRGGVAIGRLIHTNEVVFGPALVEAHHIESKVAKYPRIIVDKTAINKGLKYHSKHHSKEDEEEYIMDIITEDEDGNYYIDYIEKTLSEIDNIEYGAFNYINNLQENFFTNYENEDKEVKEKLDWLRNKISLLKKNN